MSEHKQLSLFEAASVVAGLGVGGGIMAVPYLAAQNGLVPIVSIMVAAYLISALEAISCLMTREGFETQQTLTIEQAIRMFTIDAAFAQFEDDRRGSISPGKQADLVVLAKNPVRTPAAEISQIKVEKTIINGKVVFEA